MQKSVILGNCSIVKSLSLFGGIHGTIVNCYLASVSINNTLPLSSVYQISPDIHCHLPEKSQSSTSGNNDAPTSVPLSLGHALYIQRKNKQNRKYFKASNI
jgi:hypothetical protein